MAEEAKPETVRIITSSSRPGDILTKVERRALRTLKKNTALTILQADNDNANVILNTVDYNQKIISLLEGPSCRWLTRDPTELTEQKTTLLLKNPHSQKMYLNNCVQLAADPRNHMDFRRSLERGSFWDPLLVTVLLLPTNFSSTWQDFSAISLGILHTI